MKIRLNQKIKTEDFAGIFSLENTSKIENIKIDFKYVVALAHVLPLLQEYGVYEYLEDVLPENKDKYTLQEILDACLIIYNNAVKVKQEIESFTDEDTAEVD